MRDTLIATSSCQYPSDFFRYREAYKSLGAIANLFAHKESKKLHRVVMLAGDLIYADATAGLLDATDPHERFTQQYHKLRNSWAWRDIDSHERLFSIDDHELIDDWVPLHPDHPDADLRKMRQQTREQGKMAFVNEMLASLNTGGKTYYNKLVNELPVFVMDTRTERTARNARNINDASLISDEQLSMLHNWIDDLADQDGDKSDSVIAPKIILSGSILLPRLRSTADRWDIDPSHASCLRSDGWDGYPKTMHQILSHIVKKRLRKVVFVSGDAHIPCLCNVRIVSKEHGSVNIVSVHGSGLNAPFPFANSVAEEFQSIESFALSDDENAEKLDITVNTHFPDVGDGFCTIRTSSVDGRNVCQISFAGKRNNYVPVPFGEV